MNKYEEWIQKLLASGAEIHGMCNSICELMRKDFPELEMHGGYVITALGTDVHFWLEDPDGNIVDPTEEQFGLLSIDDYRDSGLQDATDVLNWYLNLKIKLPEEMASL